MFDLLPHETILIGKWIEVDGRVLGDQVSERIYHLTNGVLDVVQDHPRDSGWTRLYRDKGDGRHWERTYADSGFHGGGPPTLRCIAENELKQEYGFEID